MDTYCIALGKVQTVQATALNYVLCIYLLECGATLLDGNSSVLLGIVKQVIYWSA